MVQIDDADEPDWEKVKPLVATGTLEDKETDDVAVRISVTVLQENTRHRNIPQEVSLLLENAAVPKKFWQ